MQNDTLPSVPPQTRDMGVADFNRPPFAAALDALRELEISYGTDALAEALKTYQRDADFQARERGLDPDRPIRGIREAYSNSSNPDDKRFADLLISIERSKPVATPFPGLAVA